MRIVRLVTWAMLEAMVNVLRSLRAVRWLRKDGSQGTGTGGFGVRKDAAPPQISRTGRAPKLEGSHVAELNGV